jgi:RHS repeat-associated protein
MLKLSGPLSAKNRYWFSSKEFIPQAGIYNYGYRFYEPNFQRWLNRDPIQEAGGINQYAFVDNSPVTFVDPYGLAGFGFGINDLMITAEDLNNVLNGVQNLVDSVFGDGTSETMMMGLPGLGEFGEASEEAKALENAANEAKAAANEAKAAEEAAEAAKAAKPSLSDCKAALKKAQDKVGKQPKGAPGKYGSPQRGTPKKGYRMDPGHPNRPPGDPESGPHMNWWDYTGGKRGSGGQSGAIPIPPDDQ